MPVVGKRQKVIALLPVNRNRFLRRLLPVRAGGVHVQIPLIPLFSLLIRKHNRSFLLIMNHSCPWLFTGRCLRVSPHALSCPRTPSAQTGVPCPFAVHNIMITGRPANCNVFTISHGIIFSRGNCECDSDRQRGFIPQNRVRRAGRVLLSLLISLRAPVQSSRGMPFSTTRRAGRMLRQQLFSLRAPAHKKKRCLTSIGRHLLPQEHYGCDGRRKTFPPGNRILPAKALSSKGTQSFSYFSVFPKIFNT